MYLLCTVKLKLKSIPFITISKIIKILWKNLIKDVRDLYSKSYKTLLREINEELNEVNIVFID